MGLFDAFSDSRDEFDGAHHASVTHEVLGGAVAYEAMKAYEDHQAANGKPDSHARAKEIAAGLAGAALDRLVETKGLDYWDERKRQQALDHANQQINETVFVNEYPRNDY